MKKKIYFVNGALGSGKTTLINQLILSGKLGKLFIIENEFSSLSIDNMCLHLYPKQIKTLAGECICCADPESLQKELGALVDSKYENIIIESSGVTSLNQLLSKVISNQSLSENFSIGGCVFLIDSLGIDRTNVNDLELANFVIVTKYDELKNLQDVEGLDNFIKKAFPQVKFLIKQGLGDEKWIGELLNLEQTNFRDWDLKINDSKHHGQNFMRVLLSEDLKNFNPEKVSLLMKEKKVLRIKGFYQKNGLIYHLEATPELSKLEVSVAETTKLGLVVIGENKVLLEEFVKKCS